MYMKGRERGDIYRRGIVFQTRPVLYVNNVRLLSTAEGRLPRFRNLNAE